MKFPSTKIRYIGRRNSIKSICNDFERQVVNAEEHFLMVNIAFNDHDCECLIVVITYKNTGRELTMVGVKD